MSEVEPIITLWGEPEDNKVGFLMEYQRICARVLGRSSTNNLWIAVVKAKEHTEELRKENDALREEVAMLKGWKAA